VTKNVDAYLQKHPQPTVPSPAAKAEKTEYE
jgi:hypothetical protein